jgi:molecular chaperone GrpE
MWTATDHPPEQETERAPEEGPAPERREGEPPNTAPKQAQAAEMGESRDLATELEKAQAEAGALKDQLLRALAEAENTRRRTHRDREEFARYAASPLAKDILPVADNLARALAAVPQEALDTDEALKNLVEGIAATDRQLRAALERHHIKRIDPQGERFDSHRHQAMFEVSDSGQPSGTIVQVLQPGYMLHDRLLRPALVGVAKAEPASAQTANSGEESPGD